MSEETKNYNLYLDKENNTTIVAVDKAVPFFKSMFAIISPDIKTEFLMSSTDLQELLDKIQELDLKSEIPTMMLL